MTAKIIRPIVTLSRPEFNAMVRGLASTPTAFFTLGGTRKDGERTRLNCGPYSKAAIGALKGKGREKPADLLTFQVYNRRGTGENATGRAVWRTMWVSSLDQCVAFGTDYRVAE